VTGGSAGKAQGIWMAMNFCAKCGTPISAARTFKRCTNCGAPQNMEAVKLVIKFFAVWLCVAAALVVWLAIR
jgi:hypothetical protein